MHWLREYQIIYKVHKSLMAVINPLKPTCAYGEFPPEKELTFLFFNNISMTQPKTDINTLFETQQNILK